MLDLDRIQAITLDLDDTLWPVWPTIHRAEQVLVDWLGQHAPQAATLTRDAQAHRAVRRRVNTRYPDRAHDLSFLRREAIRELLGQAG
ncbi:MAG: HAD family hydrolase, partial [Betaproteobacteria bacterium]|nr:HAD family hydrolase [Betaproteobacteria bacterium]